MKTDSITELGMAGMARNMMRAAVYTKYGRPDVVLKVKDVPIPTPKKNEVLIKNRASTVTAGDMRLLNLIVPTGLSFLVRLMLGFDGPKKQILGITSVGEIVNVGADVTLFKKGDQVLAHQGFDLMGAHAEYSCIPEDVAIVKKPDNMSDGEAAALPFGGLTSLIFLRDLTKIQPGQKLLVYGASGDVGTYAVQLGKYYGAHVTAVCGTKNLELMKSLGADSTIDYTAEDFTADGETYDVVFDAVGKSSFSTCKDSLTKNGIYITAVAGLPQFAEAFWNNSCLRSSKKMINGMAAGKTKQEELDNMKFLVQLAESGKIKPVIEKHYSLEDIVEAHLHVLTGHKVGSVVIDME